MIIISQNKKVIYNFDNVQSLHILSKGAANQIIIVSADNIPYSIGDFDRKIEVEKAFDMLKTAILSKENSFTMPSNVEVTLSLLDKTGQKD